jgi:hypothetical protein
MRAQRVSRSNSDLLGNYPVGRLFLVFLIEENMHFINTFVNTEVFFMEKDEDIYGSLTEFDYMMAAMSIYCMTGMTKEEFWTIINHVNDGFEFDAAVEAQENLIAVVDRHYEMKRYFDKGV